MYSLYYQTCNRSDAWIILTRMYSLHGMILVKLTSLQVMVYTTGQGRGTFVTYALKWTDLTVWNIFIHFVKCLACLIYDKGLIWVSRFRVYDQPYHYHSISAGLNVSYNSSLPFSDKSKTVIMMADCRIDKKKISVFIRPISLGANPKTSFYFKNGSVSSKHGHPSWFYQKAVGHFTINRGLLQERRNSIFWTFSLFCSMVENKKCCIFW